MPPLDPSVVSSGPDTASPAGGAQPRVVQFSELLPRLTKAYQQGYKTTNPAYQHPTSQQFSQYAKAYGLNGDVTAMRDSDVQMLETHLRNQDDSGSWKSYFNPGGDVSDDHSATPLATHPDPVPTAPTTPTPAPTTTPPPPGPMAMKGGAAGGAGWATTGPAGLNPKLGANIQRPSMAALSGKVY